MADEQAETIAFLSRPEAYGGAGPVERIETPTSLLFLSGQYALKLKRAVTFAFLDYARVDQRHAACEAELRLNRRTAPDLYLGVEPVCRSADGALHLGGSGEPIDWVVRMRRFDQAGLFDRLAAHDALTPPLLRDLADRIAAFHEKAEPAPGHGGASAVRGVIDLIRTSMAGLEAVLGEGAGDRWHRRAVATQQRVASLLDARRTDGRVRRCHGDLHLRNICLIGGEPVLFDCIEFSDDLACIDTLYDLAFLLMDLWQRGLRLQANVVFNRYVDISGDDGGLAALPLFMAMRAGVRAHVCASAAMMRNDAAEGEAARQYMAAAFDCLETRPARIVAIGGLSGTGKSTLAQALAPHLGNPPGARLLRSDVLRKRLLGVVPETRLEAEGYAPAVTKMVYARLAGQAHAAIAAGHAVVADAMFGDAREREAIAGVGAPFDGLWLEASADVLLPRVAARAGDASDADVRVLEKQLAAGIGAPAAWRKIDAGKGARATVAAAARSLGLEMPPQPE